MKVIWFFINAIFWLWIFIVPAGLFGFVGFLLYKDSSANLIYTIILLIIGIALGILLAEHIRKKYGVLYLFGRLLATPELEENEKIEGDENSN